MTRYIPAMALVGLNTPAVGQAQDDPTLAEFNSAVENARTLVQAERRVLVADALTLTAAESSAFWPVYDRYMADMRVAGDLQAKAITTYAANYGNLTDEVARQLIADTLKFQEKSLQVRKSYLRKFRAVLPEIKLARFYQIENKLDAITNFALAAQIPMIEAP